MSRDHWSPGARDSCRPFALALAVRADEASDADHMTHLVGACNKMAPSLARIASRATMLICVSDAKRMLYLATSQDRLAATVKRDNASVLGAALEGRRMCVM